MLLMLINGHSKRPAKMICISTNQPTAGKILIWYDHQCASSRFSVCHHHVVLHHLDHRLAIISPFYFRFSGRFHRRSIRRGSKYKMQHRSPTELSKVNNDGDGSTVVSTWNCFKWKSKHGIICNKLKVHIFHSFHWQCQMIIFRWKSNVGRRQMIEREHECRL